MYFDLGPDGDKLEAIYRSGNITLFLSVTANLFLKLAEHRGVHGKAYFEKGSDRRMQELAEWITKPHVGPTQTNTIVHVATEVYTLGGHTRIIEDIARAMPDRRHILIMTDMLGSFAEGRMQLGALEERFNSLNIEVMWLPKGEILSRAIMLSTMIANIAPGVVFVNLHPYDTIGYAGISGKSAPRVLFLHHADHYPALGSMRHDYEHIDLTNVCHSICRSSELENPKLLPMTVSDHGVADVNWDGPLVAAVSGTHIKFFGDTGGRYSQLAAALLSSGVQTIHHIGSVIPELENEIRQELRQANIEQNRYVFHGGVPNLAAKLKEIAPNFVLNSHPQGGGKAIIESISLGLPVMYYSPPEKLAIFGGGEIGACAVFSRLEDAGNAVRTIQEKGQETGRANRALYEKNHSPEVFRKFLLDLTSSQGT